MTSFELLAIVVLFLLGYWLVSAIWPKLSRKDDAQDPAGERWHDVLGVSPGASTDEIEQAYRTQLEKYHPDKVAQLGPELQIVARRMTERIEAAYAQARKARQ